MSTTKKRPAPRRFRAAIFRAGDLIRTTEIPPEEPILYLLGTRGEDGYVICVQDMVLLFASRGIGKSLFALGLSIAIATGGEFLCWKAKKPRKVLYVDGEMPGRRIQKRLREMTEGLSKLRRYYLDRNLAFIARDWQGKGKRMPRLDTPEGEHAVERLLSPNWKDADDEFLEVHLEGPQKLASWGARVVVIDNAACLFDPEGESDPKAWQPASEWLQSLRDKGITTLLVHHASRTGTSRGHSSKEDLMDTAIQLTRPQGYQARDGAKFKVDFTKGRSLFGDAADPVIAHLKRGEGWTWEPAGKVKKKTVKDARNKLHEAIRDYVRANDGCSANRIETCVRGGSGPIREALSELLTAGEIKKLKNGGFSLE